MNYRIEGGNLPVVIISLNPGESVQCESGAMSWMTAGIKMSTSTGGGIGKMFGRMVTGEGLMVNTYTAEQAGEIAFASSFPGSIKAVEINGNSFLAQKGAFLASFGNVEQSVGIQKNVGGGFFGGEGFLMQKFTGNGIVFLEVDGSAIEYDLNPGEKMIVDTGYTVMMDSTVNLEVEMVKGVKNVLFGGEGLFNTTLTGPGHIMLQTMPVSSTAAILYKYMPKTK
ncbi:MAG: TIGR00266 family protein [Clostridiales bacterium]|nr:TIGR00266 family protein [Clostridiales bacterium]